MGAIRWTALILTVCVAAVAAQDAPPRSLPDVMPVDQVQRGMEGYGLTVFAGAEVEKFQFKVVGKIRNWAAQGTVILVRMSGENIDESGTIAGMSGSPVYIDDKLVGAIAYGFYYAQVPIAGVTPIEEMLVVRDIDAKTSEEARAEATAARRARAREELADAVARTGADMRAGRLATSEQRAAALTTMLSACGRPPAGPGGATTVAPDGGFRRLPTPISVGGLSREAYGAISQILPGGAFVPMQGGAVGSEGASAAVLEPGAPIGALLATGDMEVAGMGTLTAIDGERVLAFGHPMDGVGAVDYPLVLGDVAAVIPSAYHSFRLTTPTRVVGRLVQDRDSAILGRLDETSPMFPVTVTISGVETKTYHYDVASYWEVAPWIVHMVTSASFVRWEGNMNRLTVQATARIRLAGREEPIEVTNRFASDYHDWMIMELLTFPLAELVMNPFSEVRIAGVEVEMDVTPEWRAVEIDEVRLLRENVKPGETLDLEVKIRPWRGEPELRRMSLPVPPDAAPGPVLIEVCDARTAFFNRTLADHGRFDTDDIRGVIASVQSVPSSAGIYAYASFMRRGLRYEGAAMPQLPDSAMYVLTHGEPTTDLAPLIGLTETSIDTPYVVEGQGRAQGMVIDPARGTGLEYP